MKTCEHVSDRKVESNLVLVVTYGVLLFLCGFLLRSLLRWVLKRVHRRRQGQAKDARGEILDSDRGLITHTLVPLPPGCKVTICGLDVVVPGVVLNANIWLLYLWDSH